MHTYWVNEVGRERDLGGRGRSSRGRSTRKNLPETALANQPLGPLVESSKEFRLSGGSTKELRVSNISVPESVLEDLDSGHLNITV